ncbi:MAG: winged helix-turn-helix transcriptional regulator [Elusimicrobia bacterium]|nr:winged helix-turn-helix transcriptional regulator [Elusimicrobiota bacterium]MDE2424531.1 winged helix-turn-helix transcriptional regulator [Elusimicrobiota bacterium]
MLNRERLDAGLKVKADFLRALSNPVRLAIIEELQGGELPVGRMVERLSVEQSSLSKHLAILRHAGLVVSRKRKSTVLYSIRNRAIFRVLRPIAQILRKRMAESRDIFAQLGRS